MRLKRNIGIMLLAVGILFCGGSPAVAEEPSDISLDLFMARGFLGGTDYERYNLQNGVLWFECGGMTDKPRTDFQPLRGDDVLPPNARIKVTERHVKKLDAQRLNAFVVKIKETNEIDFEGKFLPAGTIFGVSGGGIVDLKLIDKGLSKRITVSVDEVSDSKRSEARIARDLIEYLRGSADVICDARTFYGLGRK